MQKRNQCHWLSKALILGLCIFAIFTGCKKQDVSNKTGQPKTIVVGGVFPTSGKLAVFGLSGRDGLMEGVMYANRTILADHPVKMEARVEDSRGEPQAGVLAFRKLVDGGARICTSILSNVCVALKPLADGEGVLLFADATHSSLVNGSTLRHSQTAKQEADFITNHCRNNLKARNLFALVTDDDYGNSFEKALGKDVTILRYDPKATEFNSLAGKAISGNPDAIVLVGVGGPLGELIRSIRERHYKGHLVATVAFGVLPTAREIAGDAVKGLWYPVIVQDTSAFNNLKGTDGIKLAGASTIKIIEFNNAVFVAQAIKDGHTTPETIRSYLLNNAELHGVGVIVKPQADGTLMPTLKMNKME